MNFTKNPIRPVPRPCSVGIIRHVNGILCEASELYGCYVSEIVGPGKRSPVAKARVWSARRLMGTVAVRRVVTGLTGAGNKKYAFEAQHVPDSSVYPARCNVLGRWRRCSMKMAAHLLNLNHSTLVRSCKAARVEQ